MRLTLSPGFVGSLAVLLGLTTAGCSGSGDDPAAAGPDLDLSGRCTAALDSLYLAPTGLPAFSPERRGDVVGCAPFASYTADEVAQRLAGVPGASTVGGAVEVYLVAYRTAREPATVEGVSTALLYLPEHLMEGGAPTVLAAHGTVGVADRCAPSHQIDDPTAFQPPGYFDALYLAWAARGMPVVAPDYAGLGTPGVHDYSNWFDPARSAIDAVRALRGLVPPAGLDGSVVVQGHSQGGGIALTVSALAEEAPDLDLRAVVATTPGWRYATSIVDALGLSSISLNPNLRAVAAFTAYAALANLTDDATQHGAMYEPAVRAPVLERVKGECYGPALTALDTAAAGYVPPTTLGEFVDDDFLAAVQACTGGGDCTTLAGRFVLRDQANDPHLPAGGPPVLITASTDDEQLTMGQVGCLVDRVEQDGADFEFCAHTGPDHHGMVFQHSAYSIEWALAAARGTARPPCTGDTTRVLCSLF